MTHHPQAHASAALLTQAAVHATDALHAAWQAYLADVPMTWLPHTQETHHA